MLERHRLRLRKRLARPKLARAVDFCSVLVMDDHQFRFVQIQHLARLCGDLQFILAAQRRESPLIADFHDLERIGIDQMLVAYRQSRWRSAEQISDKSKSRSIPRVKIGTRAGWQSDLVHRKQFARLDWDIREID